MGDLEPLDITLAVCAGFHDRPGHCRRDVITDWLTNRDDWEIPSYGRSIYEEVLFVGFIIIAINVTLLVYCKHRQASGNDKAVVEMEVN